MAEPAFTDEEIQASIGRVRAARQDSGAPAPAPAAAAGDFSDDEIMASIARVRSQPAPRQEPLDMLERMAASRADDEPERLEKILKDRGFRTKREGNQVLIDKDGKFVPWDPAGADIGDLFDLVPDALEIGVGALATSAKVAGAVGAPATGGGSLAAGMALAGAAGGALEAGFQGIEKLAGVREEFDPGRIGTVAATTATIPGLGKIIGAGGKAAGKAAQKAGLKKAATSPAAEQTGKVVLQMDEEAVKAARAAQKAKAPPGPTSARRVDQPTDPFRVRKTKGTPKDISDKKLAEIMQGRELSKTTGRKITDPKGPFKIRKSAEEVPDLTAKEVEALQRSIQKKGLARNIPADIAEAAAPGLGKIVRPEAPALGKQVANRLGENGAAKARLVFKVIKWSRVAKGDVTPLVTDAIMKKVRGMSKKAVENALDAKKPPAKGPVGEFLKSLRKDAS